MVPLQVSVWTPISEFSMEIIRANALWYLLRYEYSFPIWPILNILNIRKQLLCKVADPWYSESSSYDNCNVVTIAQLHMYRYSRRWCVCESTWTKSWHLSNDSRMTVNQCRVTWLNGCLSVVVMFGGSTTPQLFWDYAIVDRITKWLWNNQ